MSTQTKLFSVVALALGLLAAPGAASAAIVISDTSSAVPWLVTSGTPTTATDFALTGTETFTVTPPVLGNSVLVVNYTALAQGSTGLVLTPSMSWNGVPLQAAIVKASTSSSFVIADVFYLYNPTPAVNGSLVISGSGRDALIGAYTLTGVNTNVAPAGFANQSASNTVAITLPATTPANGFATITTGYRYNSGLPLSYTTTSGPAAVLQWSGTDVSSAVGPPIVPNLVSGSAYISGLTGGSLTLTQSDNATSRNVLSVAVFSPGVDFSSAKTWSASGGGSWNSSANWGGTVPSGTGAVALFTSNPTSAAAVTLDAPITLNALVISNSNQISITPGSGGSLTLASSANVAPTVFVGSGSDSVSAPVSLNATTIFNVNFGQSLSISGNVANGTASSGIGLTGGGTLVLGGSNSYTGTTTVTGGSLNVTTSLGNTPLAVTAGALTVAGSVGNGSIVSAGNVNIGGSAGAGRSLSRAGT